MGHWLLVGDAAIEQESGRFTLEKQESPFGIVPELGRMGICPAASTTLPPIAKFTW